MADIRIKTFHGYPEDLEVNINKWLDDTGNVIEEIDVCASHENTGTHTINIQVFCLLRYKV